MMSTRFVHNNIHVGFLLIVFSRIKDTQLLGRFSEVGPLLLLLLLLFAKFTI